MAKTTSVHPRRRAAKAQVGVRATATPAAQVWFVYLLECRGGVLYCGITPNLAARFERHRSGRGAAFTRMRPPLRMLAATPCESRAGASRLEAEVKRLPASAKRALAARWPLREGLPALAPDRD